MNGWNDRLDLGMKVPPMIATLHREQIIPADLDAVWSFFATPRNLDALSPPNMKFQIVSSLPERMYQGQLIEYRVGILPGIWLRWLTEIRHVREGESFVDEQRVGPYKLWYHEHRFEPVEGGVKMTDRVTYSVGYGPIGWAMHKIWIRRKLKAIFDYRRQAIGEIYGLGAV